MTSYTHKVQYYETDRMGITHHSNYIRWMEEARIDFLARIGFPYDRLESEGISSPVLKVEGQFKESTTFGDEVYIDVKIKEFKGIRLLIEYEMRKAGKDNIIFKGISEHCFLDGNARPMNIKAKHPEFYKVLSALV